MTTAIEGARPPTPPPNLEGPEPGLDCEVTACAAVDARTERASRDAATMARVAVKIDDFVADMFSLIEIYQARTRDTQSSTQERDIRARSTTANEAQVQRTAEMEQAVTDRARAAESKGIGDIFRVIGAVLSGVIGIVGALFTGGASLVVAVAIIVAVVGPLVMNELANAGVVDQETAMAVGLGIAAVCTAVSLGCSAASLAGAITNTALVVVEKAVQAAIEVGVQVATIVNGAVGVTTGALDIATAVLKHDSAGHSINATELAHRRDAERELQEQATELLTALARSFGRVSESLAACREEGTRAGRVALAAA